LSLFRVCASCRRLGVGLQVLMARFGAGSPSSLHDGTPVGGVASGVHGGKYLRK
jgi:hypothetical protein